MAFNQQVNKWLQWIYNPFGVRSTPFGQLNLRLNIALHSIHTHTHAQHRKQAVSWVAGQMDSHSALFTWQLSCGTKIQIKHEFGKRFSHHLCMYVATSITYLDEPRNFYNKFAYLTGDICERAYIVKACAARMTVLQVSVLKAELNKCMSLLSNWRRFATLR